MPRDEHVDGHVRYSDAGKYEYMPRDQGTSNEHVDGHLSYSDAGKYVHMPRDEGTSREHVDGHVNYADMEDYRDVWRSGAMLLVLCLFAFVVYGKVSAVACIAWTVILFTVVQGMCQAFSLSLSLSLSLYIYIYIYIYIFVFVVYGKILAVACIAWKVIFLQ